MEPLDLRTAPPRAPRAELAGLVFLPRSIDKIRATLPGGHLGEYTIEGFTERMLEEIGISVDELTAAVRAAKSDDDVANFVTGRAKPEGIAQWNEFALNRLLFKGDRAAAIAEYPYLAERDDIIYSLDFLEDDDHRTFAKSSS